MEQKRRCHWVPLGGCPAPYHPSRKSLESGKEAATAKDLDLGEPPKLEPEVAYFLRGSTENSKEEDEVSPEPPVEEFYWWVLWKVETCETPSWWRELVAVLEVGEVIHSNPLISMNQCIIVPVNFSKYYIINEYHFLMEINK